MASKLVTGLLVVGLVMFLVGPGQGYQAIKPALAEAGVGLDVCQNMLAANQTSCAEQTNMLDEYNALSLTLMNALCFVVGVLVDLYGTRTMAYIAIPCWTLGEAIKAMSPGSGTFFLMSEVSTAILGLFVLYAALYDYAAELTVFGSAFLAQSVTTGAWNASSITYVWVVRLASWLGSPLWLTFLVYALVVGGISMLLVMIMFPAANFWGSLLAPHAEMLRTLGRSMCGVICEPMFWMGAMVFLPPVCYAYFFMSQVPEHMKYLGADDNEAQAYADVFSIMLPFGAFFGALPGLILRNGNMLKGMLIVARVQMGLGIILWLCTFFGHRIPHEFQYLTFASVILFRIITASFNTVVAPLVFPSHVLGTSFACLISFAGVFSVIMQPIMKDFVASDPSHFGTVHNISSFAVVACWWLWVAVARRKLDPHSGKTHAVRVLELAEDRECELLPTTS